MLIARIIYPYMIHRATPPTVISRDENARFTWN